MSVLTVPKRLTRLPVVFSGKVRIPGWVVDHKSYRRWARSKEYPKSGWFSYLDGELWVELEMEQVFTHNLIKTAMAAVLFALVQAKRLGYFFSDRMLLSHPTAGLTTEPDGLFFFFDTLRTGRVKLVPGAEGGYVELEGTPDMALEVVSPSSEKKDTEILRNVYWRAGIQEYWLVDVRGPALRFDIFRQTDKGYALARRQNGWVKSVVFGESFRLVVEADPLGNPSYRLVIKS